MPTIDARLAHQDVEENLDQMDLVANLELQASLVYLAIIQLGH